MAKAKKAKKAETKQMDISVPQTGNISRLRRDELVEKIGEIKAFLEKSSDANAVRLLRFAGEVEREVRDKKFGLVFEEHRENVDIVLEENLPVLTEVKKKFLSTKDDAPLNFLIEGDNLAALKLLEKTHRGKIDFIYIDPPYNTGNDFIYNDNYVAKDDAYRHSKWLSFMSKRLKIAKRLLSNSGFLFVQIDDNEHAPLKLLCDKILGEEMFLTTIAWEKRTKCQNTKTSRKMLQPKIEYILVYKNKSARVEFNCHVIGVHDYPETDDKGAFRIEEVGQMGITGVRGRGSMVFPILGISPRDGNQWKIGKDTAAEFLGRGDMFKDSGKVYRRIRPYDEATDKIKPFWAFFSAEQFGTAESAKNELSHILGRKDHEFETVKPSQLISEIIFQATKGNSIVLDFFAGSGTTLQATLEVNAEYGGKRSCILVTNNENGICEKVTYQRVKRVIKKENYNARLKYMKIGYQDISGKLYYEYADDLLKHIRELVELENAVDFAHEKSLAIVLTQKELDALVKNDTRISKCKVVYVGHDVTTTGSAKKAFAKYGIEKREIPEYYYPELEK